MTSLSFNSSRIQALLMDFDGVLTDNFVYTTSTGDEFVKTSKFDSFGLSLVKDKNIFLAVISSEHSPVVMHRCNKLSIPCYHKITDKVATAIHIAEMNNFSLDNAIFVGNDLNDLPLLNLVGHPIIVSDAHPQLFDYSFNVTSSKGGNGALREIIDYIFSPS